VDRARGFARRGGVEIFENGGESGEVSRAREIDFRPHEGTEDSRLVDRLIRPCAAKFRRTVGGDKNERDTGMEGLDAGWQEVGDGRSTGGDADRRTTCGHGPTERGERHSALIIVDGGIDSLLDDSGDQSRSTGSGADENTAGSEFLESA
jgi:hypothetical protein